MAALAAVLLFGVFSLFLLDSRAGDPVRVVFVS
jgi:hypothetical protein